MRIYLLSCVFPPEPVVSAQTSMQIVRELVVQGSEVTIITSFPNRPSGQLFPGYKRTLFASEHSTDGYFLLRCFSFLSRESSMFSRWLENISFGFTTSLALFFLPRPNVIYSNTWPIFAAGLVCLACRIRNIPIVISVQDMYPESLVMQGRIQPGQWQYKLLLLIDRWIANQASAVITLTDRFADGFTGLRLVNSSKVHLIANWVDSDSIVMIGKDDYREELNISKEAFVLVYGGNIGMAAGVETVIEALSKVNRIREIVLVIAGSGSRLEACKKLAEGFEGRRILFHSPWATSDTSKVLAAADVLVLPTRGSQSLASVPSKLLSYLLSARPVLALVLPESDTADIIKKTGCGWIIPPDNVNLLAKKIEELSDNPEEELKKMGLLGRKYALMNFTTETCLPKVIDIITKAAGVKCEGNEKEMIERC
ncbi:MAG: glycosyltransferase family 4 protein [Anaerolineaceae bacterium]|nr:glycosyltransferase family 4 protein [Anaerolineaceae bacterium]